VTGFAAADLSRDAFLDGRLTLWQPRRGYRAGIDPVFLAAFAPAQPGHRVLDLGCGVGAAALCLGARAPGLDLHGLELQPGYADLARRNAAANAVAFAVHEGDLRRPPAALRALSFDLVLVNPPYHPVAATAADDSGRDRALREVEASLPDWIAAGLRRLAPGGTLVLIHLASRLADVLCGIGDRAGAIDVLPLAPRPGRPAERILVRARKGSRAPLSLHAPLTLHEGNPRDADGESYSPAAQAVLRAGSGLLIETI
jgi:tRNA1Val (adenine37-N6)-methyltransferase